METYLTRTSPVKTPVRISVLPRRKISGIESWQEFPTGQKLGKNGNPVRVRTDVAPLVDALAETWPEDAHLVQYLALDSEGNPVPYRLNSGCLADIVEGGGSVSMVVVCGDWDTPGHVPWSEAPSGLLEEREALIRSLNPVPIFWRTRAGHRLLHVLKEPVALSPEDPNRWYRAYAWYRGWLEASGIEVDNLKDWPRIHRLPLVHRNGKPPKSEWAPRWPENFEPLDMQVPDPPPAPVAPARSRLHMRCDKRASKWALAGLDAELDRMANAVPGERHNTLVSVGHCIGGLAHLLPGQDLQRLIFDSIPADSRDAKAWKTAGHALEHGMATPRFPQDKPDWKPAAPPPKTPDEIDKLRFLEQIAKSGVTPGQAAELGISLTHEEEDELRLLLRKVREDLEKQRKSWPPLEAEAKEWMQSHLAPIAREAFEERATVLRVGRDLKSIREAEKKTTEGQIQNHILDTAADGIAYNLIANCKGGTHCEVIRARRALNAHWYQWYAGAWATLAAKEFGEARVHAVEVLALDKSYEEVKRTADRVRRLLRERRRDTSEQYRDIEQITPGGFVITTEDASLWSFLRKRGMNVRQLAVSIRGEQIVQHLWSVRCRLSFHLAYRVVARDLTLATDSWLSTHHLAHSHGIKLPTEQQIRSFRAEERKPCPHCGQDCRRVTTCLERTGEKILGENSKDRSVRAVRRAVVADRPDLYSRLDPYLAEEMSAYRRE